MGGLNDNQRDDNIARGAKYNNMSAASRTLYISQSTVSQTILDIEKAYNVKLFERLSKKLVITEQGKIFIDTVKKS